MTLLRALLLRVLPPHTGEFIVGDLEEEYESRRRADPRAAARWYRRQAIATLTAGVFARRRLARPRAGDGSMGALVQDVRYGARMIVKQPGFAAVVVITLALAIGANTVIFSFANILLLRPLPVKDQQTLGWIYNIDPQRGSDRSRASLPDFLDYRASLKSFSQLAGGSYATLTLTGDGDALRLSANRVTVSLFDVWGLQTVQGRLFRSGEDAPGAAPIVVLSHQFWRRHFGGDPSVVGRAITLDGTPTTIVGVLDPAIEIGNLSRLDVWVPLHLDPDGWPRDDRSVSIIGRLAPGVTHEQATAEVRTVAERLQRDHPTTNTGWSARVVTTHESMTGKNTWLVLALLVLVVAFVLLIACANLANLVLARSIDRKKEIAVRTALGAGRLRLVRQLVTENLCLGILGGGAGLAIAYGGQQIIKAVSYEEFFALLSIDTNVLIFVSTVSLLTPLFFGLLPALHASRSDLVGALKEGSTRMIGGLSSRRGRAALVVAQVALALSLVVVAALIVRTMIAIGRVPVGFNPVNLLTFRVDVPQWRYAADEDRRQLYDRVLPRLASLPGVDHAAAITRLPVIGGESPTPITIEGRPVETAADQPWAVRFTASDDFFATAGVPLEMGRGFSRQDTPAGQRVAIVNREMARRYWKSSAEAIGQRVTLSDRERQPEWRTIVGIAGDTKPADITVAPNPQIYIPLEQEAPRAMAFMMRARDPEQLSSAVRAAMREIDPTLAVYDLRTMEQAFTEERSSDYVLTSLYVAFAAIALLLAAAGLYGVISYSVSQRTHEIGVRVALGALPRDVQRMVFAQAARLIAIGAVLGMGGSLLIAQAMRSLLYGVSPMDPVTYVSVVAVLAIVMLAATYVPVRRAMKIDPVQALRT